MEIGVKTINLWQGEQIKKIWLGGADQKSHLTAENWFECLVPSAESRECQMVIC